ncbi:MAG: DUF6770 family protein [Flavisolibacter sp.]
MKIRILAVLFCLMAQHTFAQTKVFKEVSEEVSSQMHMIHQDGNLVGYLVFTELEKANADSFNYKLSIMDENLNDIGKVEFREQKLKLQSVAFEQDVICLAYVKSNILGSECKNMREVKNAQAKGKNWIFTQFVDLNGKIIKTNSVETELEYSSPVWKTTRILNATAALKHDVQLKNISGKGFALFYGDQSKNNLLMFDAKGKQIFQEQIKEDAVAFGLLTSGANIHLLYKKGAYGDGEGGYELLGFNTADSTKFPKYILKDKKGNYLKVLAFDVDPSTNKPYISGHIINGKQSSFGNAADDAKGAYAGVFTININGSGKSDVAEHYSYWNDGSMPAISKTGLYKEKKHTYARQVRSFMDYDGNSYFVGSAYVKKARVGAIVASIITAPLLIPAIALLAPGTHKARITDITVLKQNNKGQLSVENVIDGNATRYVPAKLGFYVYDNRSFNTVTNPDTKTSYLVMDDPKQIMIYNVNKKKIVRTIPHKDGNIRTYVYGAKEGHIMVSEYNSKERETRYSIEAL